MDVDNSYVLGLIIVIYGEMVIATPTTVKDSVSVSVSPYQCSQECFELSRKLVELQDTVDKIQNTVEALRVYKDCEEIFREGSYQGDGVYVIHPRMSTQSFQVYCQQDSDGVWTVIQRRIDSGEDFYRYWADYTVGFGQIDSNHWLGNQKIHEISHSGLYRLRVNLEDWEGNSAYAEYDGFYIEGESDKYKLRYTSYAGGTAGDSLGFQKDMQFSTRDQDNDVHDNDHCAEDHIGAWWYRSCFRSHLTGLYYPTSNVPESGDGILWYDWKGNAYSLKKTTMKLKQM